MDAKDVAFHDSFKPRWGPMDSLVCAKSDMEPLPDADQRWQERFSVFSEARDIAVMGYNQSSNVCDPEFNSGFFSHPHIVAGDAGCSKATVHHSAY